MITATGGGVVGTVVVEGAVEGVVDGAVVLAVVVDAGAVVVVDADGTVVVVAAVVVTEVVGAVVVATVLTVVVGAVPPPPHERAVTRITHRNPMDTIERRARSVMHPPDGSREAVLTRDRGHQHEKTIVCDRLATSIPPFSQGRRNVSHGPHQRPGESPRHSTRSETRGFPNQAPADPHHRSRYPNRGGPPPAHLCERPHHTA